MKIFMIIIFGIVCCSICQVCGSRRPVREIVENLDTDTIKVRTAKELELAEKNNKSAMLDFIGLVEQYEGYTAEEYEVETSDGYILKLHRVSGSASSPAAYGKAVVYIGHGLGANSDFFAVMGPQQSLLYMLADAGYDVWIGNFRGNVYSNRHRKYSTNEHNLKYWDFSMDEIGLIDLPLFIDTVLQKTNKTKLSYIGYSMGTTVSAILLSDKPEYNKKMHVVINVAPVILFTPPFNPLATTLLALTKPAKIVAIARRQYRVPPRSKSSRVNRKDTHISTTSWMILNKICHVDRINKTVLPMILKYMQGRTSIFTSDQFAQFARKGKFQHYDHGVPKNWKKYGSPSPPEYDLTKVTSPQAIFHSDADIFSNVHDIKTLNSTFPNVVAIEQVPGFNHMDFMWLYEAREVIFRPLLEILYKNAKE